MGFVLDAELSQSDIWAPPEEEREKILQPDMMNEAAVLLAERSPDGVSEEAHTATEWEDVKYPLRSMW